MSAASLVFMWLAMMVAMMGPAVVPLAHAYGAPLEEERGRRVAALVAGYLGVWTAFATLVGLVQAALGALGLLGSEQQFVSRAAAGAVLVTAGLYQFTPWKGVCAARCRAPLRFLAARRRGSVGWALRVGLLHGMYCAGCCWLLFAALLALGSMNFAWMMTLLAIILAERAPRLGPWVTRASGVAALAYGATLLLG